MLKKSKQIDHFNTRCKSIIVHLNTFCDKKNPEELHHLRISIKKIKTLLRMNPGKKTERDLKKLNILFDDAGQVRTANVNLKLAREHGAAKDNILRRDQKLLDK